MQFAAILHEYDTSTHQLTEIDRINQFVYSPIPIPSDATRVHGITDERVAHEPKISACIDSILDFFHRADVAVAHNIDFDSLVIEVQLERLGRPKKFLPEQTIDTMKLTTDLCQLPKRNGAPGYKYPNLSELHTHIFGQDFAHAHDAMYDVEATVNCLQELLFDEVISIESTDEMRLF